MRTMMKDLAAAWTFSENEEEEEEEEDYEDDKDDDISDTFSEPGIALLGAYQTMSYSPEIESSAVGFCLSLEIKWT